MVPPPELPEQMATAIVVKTAAHFHSIGKHADHVMKGTGGVIDSSGGEWRGQRSQKSDRWYGRGRKARQAGNGGKAVPATAVTGHCNPARVDLRPAQQIIQGTDAVPRPPMSNPDAGQSACTRRSLEFLDLS